MVAIEESYISCTISPTISSRYMRSSIIALFLRNLGLEETAKKDGNTTYRQFLSPMQDSLYLLYRHGTLVFHLISAIYKSLLLNRQHLRHPRSSSFTQRLFNKRLPHCSRNDLTQCRKAGIFTLVYTVPPAIHIISNNSQHFPIFPGGFTAYCGQTSEPSSLKISTDSNELRVTGSWKAPLSSIGIVKLKQLPPT